MLRYTYDNIVIVTKDIALESLFSRFVHPSTPHLIILSFSHDLEHENHKSFYKHFLLTKITWEHSKYLKEQVGVFSNVKQQK